MRRDRLLLLSILALDSLLPLAGCSDDDDREAEAHAPGPSNGEAAPPPRSVQDTSDGQEVATTGSIRGRIEHRYARVFPAAVYLVRRPSDRFPAPEEVASLDQRDQTFVPRVLAIRAGSTVEFRNSDQIRHNVHSGKLEFDHNTAPGETYERLFDEPGVVTVKCHFHSSMVAYIVVVETPYFAASDDHGAFELRDVPPGEHTITFWHEKLEPVYETVMVVAGQAAEVVFEP